MSEAPFICVHLRHLWLVLSFMDTKSKMRPLILLLVFYCPLGVRQGKCYSIFASEGKHLKSIVKSKTTDPPPLTQAEEQTAQDAG